MPISDYLIYVNILEMSIFSTKMWVVLTPNLNETTNNIVNRLTSVSTHYMWLILTQTS